MEPTPKNSPDSCLPFDILAQPDDTTCGPTCLHAVYKYYHDSIDLKQVIAEVPELREGGTHAVFLACHALRRGYRATIYTYNFQVFDPTWFTPAGLDMREKLIKQMEDKADPKLQIATKGYLDFLELGGVIRFEDLTTRLIRRYLTRGVPILTGLSATYLYRTMRELGPPCQEDDVRGFPVGHFVVLCGYDKTTRQVMIADPLQFNPFAKDRIYSIAIDRVLGAIPLGIITYDANLLTIAAVDGRKGP